MVIRPTRGAPGARPTSDPLVDQLETWMRAERTKLSRNNAVAQAMDYMLKRWPAFTAFLDDGRICLSNNAPSARSEASRSGDATGPSPDPIAAARAPLPSIP